VMPCFKCFGCFRRMFSNISSKHCICCNGYIRMLQSYVLGVSFVCCRCFVWICKSRSRCCICLQWLLSVFRGFSSVSDVCSMGYACYNCRGTAVGHHVGADQQMHLWSASTGGKGD
jgi:hypothetical protein